MTIQININTSITKEQLQWISNYCEETDSSLEQISIKNQGNVLILTNEYKSGDVYRYYIDKEGKALRKKGERI